MIDSGRLRHRVRIERLDYVRDSSGAVIQNQDTGETRRDWQEVATVWAAIEPLSVREFISSQATQSELTTRITIRHRPGLDAAMRLVHLVNDTPAAIYNPAGFLPDKESGLEYLTAPCSTGANPAGQ